MDCPELLPLVEAARESWPRKDWPHWHRYSGNDSEKYATKDRLRLTYPCSLLIQGMITKLSENCPLVKGSFPDLELYGSGMHWIPEGGFLAPHVDSEKHAFHEWYRVASSVLFISPCEGGELVVDGKSVPVNPGSIATIDSSVKHWVNPVTKGERYTLSVFWWSRNGSGDRVSAKFD